MTTEPETITGTNPPARARRPKAKSPSAAPSTPSKSDTVIKLLQRTKGATSTELIAASGWQAHSVRAFISGLRKNGRVIIREARKSGEGSYRIDVAPNTQPPVTSVTRPAADKADS